MLPAVFPQWRTQRYPLTLAVAFLAALLWLTIWPIALYLRSPALRSMSWFWTSNTSAALPRPAHLGPPGKPGYYLGILPWFAFPVWLIAVWALWVRRREIRADAGLHLPLTLFLVGFLVLSGLSHDARELYALPMLPGLALLVVARSAAAAARGSQLRCGGSRSWCSAFSHRSAGSTGVALDLGFPARLHAHLLRLRPAYVPDWRLLKLAARPGFHRCLDLVHSAPVEEPAAPVDRVVPGSVALLWGIAAVLFVPWIDSANTYRGMVLSIREALPANYRCISSYNLGEPQRAMLQYFAGIVTYRETEPARKRRLRHAAGARLHARRHTLTSDGSRSGHGARPSDDKELYRLYQRRQPSRS